MEKLVECVKSNTIGNAEELENCISSMVCSQRDPIELSEENLIDALEIEGEFLVLKLHYSDF